MKLLATGDIDTTPLGSTELWFSDCTGPDAPVEIVYYDDGTARLLPSEESR